MKIYKNIYASFPCYIIKRGAARSGKMEASKSKCYSVAYLDGKWGCNESQYYNCALMKFPVVAESKESISKVVSDAIIKAVLDLVNEENKNE